MMLHIYKQNLKKDLRVIKLKGVYSFCRSVRSFVSTSVRLFVSFTPNFYVKPLLIAHTSVTIYQILFIFGSQYLSSIGFIGSYLSSLVRSLDGTGVNN